MQLEGIDAVTDKSGFNPHPLRRADAMCHGNFSTSFPRFQSSPAPKSGCNEQNFWPKQFIESVSILTRSEERMQYLLNRWKGENEEFQSSPAPKSGCNICLTKLPGAVSVFQSSPAPKSGCNKIAFTTLSILYCFNPHPLRRADAIGLVLCVIAIWFMFQSSPAPKSGCNKILLFFY